jgi:hypothetical protein
VEIHGCKLPSPGETKDWLAFLKEKRSLPVQTFSPTVFSRYRDSPASQKGSPLSREIIQPPKLLRRLETGREPGLNVDEDVPDNATESSEEGDS